jgi:flagellar biosynthesis/type III secretory pathway M-ring protein FliF/YscJ
MGNLRMILLLILLFGVLSPLSAQRKREQHKITAEDGQKAAAEKEGQAMQQKQEQYKARNEHHKEIQTKETRKRMKKNLKKAQKHSWGKDVPWYKRWFRKKKF